MDVDDMAEPVWNNSISSVRWWDDVNSCVEPVCATSVRMLTNSVWHHERGAHELAMATLSNKNNRKESSIQIFLDTCAGVSVLKDARLLLAMSVLEEPVLVGGVNESAEPLTATTWGIGPFGDAYLLPGAALNLLSFGVMVGLGIEITYSSESDIFLVYGIDLACIGGDGDKVDIEFGRVDKNYPNIYSATIEVRPRVRTKLVASVRQMRRAMESHNGLDSIRERRSRYTVAELRRADRASEIMRTMLMMSPTELLRLMAKDATGMKELGISREDVVRAVHINGPDPARVKGVTTARKPRAVDREFRESPMLMTESTIDMQADLMYVNNLVFLVVLFRPIDYPYVEFLPSRSEKDVLSAITNARAFIQKFGPRVVRLLFDGESAVMSKAMNIQSGDLRIGGGPLAVETMGGSSVEAAERLIRTIKDKCRTIWHAVRYKMPEIVVKWMVRSVAYYLARLPQPSRGDDVRSPCEKLTGYGFNAMRDTKFSFGARVLVTVSKTDNTMSERARDAIACCPTGNHRGTWNFISMSSWTLFRGDSAVVKPLSDLDITIINAKAESEVETIGRTRKLRIYRPSGPVLDWRDEIEGQQAADREILLRESVPAKINILPTNDDDSNDDDESEYSDAESEYDSDDSAATIASNVSTNTQRRKLLMHEIFGEDDSDNESTYSADNNQNQPIEDSVHSDFNNTVFDDVNQNEQLLDSGVDSGAVDEMSSAGVGNIDNGAENSEGNRSFSNNSWREPGRLRPKKSVLRVQKLVNSVKLECRRTSGRRIAHTKATVNNMRKRGEIVSNNRVFNLSVKKAIELLGDDAVSAIIGEVGQLYGRGTFRRIPRAKITPELSKLIITSSCFLKEKRTPEGIFDKLKARLVAGGHLQDRDIYGENVHAPTASTVAVFLAAGIAAKEGRAVATIDFPGAYLHADLEDDGQPVLMRLQPYETKVLVKMAPEYAIDVAANGTLVVELRKGLYGLIQSARLWYNKLSNDLKELGFKPNARDECVFNKTESDGSQTTLIIHVDDLLVTAHNEQNIDQFLQLIGEKYSALSVHRGRALDYLGMRFDWTEKGKCRVTMPGYISDVLLSAEDVKVGKAESPADVKLFEVDATAKLLDKDGAVRFHSLVAKLLYLAKRARPDLLLSVSFLARRVLCSTEQDLKKLNRVINYLRSTCHLGMVLEPNSMLQSYAWVDASYASHADYKSHTGAVIGIGKGPFWVKSGVQKLVTKSSTEAELVAASDSVGQLIWTNDFLKEQGYNVGAATLFQDNQSAIALMNNGKSNSERTRHIAIRYFFIKDRIESKEIKVEYLCTGDMIADILTKPLAVADFKRLRALLLNWPCD